MKQKGSHLKKNKTEFSKKILFVAGLTNLAVIIFAFIMMWRTLDLSPLAYLIPAVAAEVTAGTSFYYTKAKAENMIKLRQIYGKLADCVDDDETPVG